MGCRISRGEIGLAEKLGDETPYDGEVVCHRSLLRTETNDGHPDASNPIDAVDFWYYVGR